MLKFYLVIGVELLLYPFLYAYEEIKKWAGKFKSEESRTKPKNRHLDNEIIFAIHEWSGYPFVRQKKIKYVNTTFSCGLEGHFERLSIYNGKHKLRKILTLSDSNQKYLTELKKQNFYQPELEIHPVQNTSMDFSGYNYIAKNLLQSECDQVVFLTNTSVNSSVVDFIDQYTELFRQQPDLGLLGISYSTKIYQTLIKNNFRPHLQSFFLVTTSNILKEMLKKCGGNIPGSSETYKLSIIRFGEVRITEVIQELGYKVAVITEDGKLTTFPRFGAFHNGYHKWKLPLNDYRLTTRTPNMINLPATLE